MLQDSLENKYEIQDIGLKKFIVAKFMHFKMVDSKPIVTQVQEYQVLFMISLMKPYT